MEYFSTEQGLSHGTISEIVKDKEGFMWFGTWDGINRFDGRNFASFKSAQGEMAQTGDYRIVQVAEDQLGYLWIRTRYDQVYRFDKKTKYFLPVSSIIQSNTKDKICFDSIVSVKNGFVWLQSRAHGFYCIPQNNVTKESVQRFGKQNETKSYESSNVINVFHQDQQSRVWIATPNGLTCLAPSSSGVYKAVNIIPPSITTKKFTAVDEDATGIYFSTNDGNIIIYDKKTLAFAVKKITGDCITAVLRSHRNNSIYAATSGGRLISLNLSTQTITVARYKNEHLYSIYEDRSGVLWMEPGDFGVLRFDPQTAAFSFFSKKVKDPKNILGNRFKVFEDINGNVWVNMKCGGFGYYNTAKGNMEFTLDAVNMSAFKLPEAVYHSYYDSTGVLWLRIHGGVLVRIIFQEENFKQQLLVEHDADLVDNEVRGILCDNKNRLWMASKSSKVYLRQNNQWVSNFFVNTPKDGLGNVYVIYQDSRENIWLGTKGNGLFRATPVDGKAAKYRLQHFNTGVQNNSGITSNNIYTITEDKQHRIWIGTFAAGLMLAQEKNDSVKFIHTGNAFKNYPKEGFYKIRHMTLDPAGNIWVGATDGLLIIDADDNHSTVYNYKVYPKVSDNTTGMGSSDIQFIYCDWKGRMWLATSGAGLSLATGNPFKQLNFKNYTKKDGLPNDYVLSCSGDKQGDLWIATENVLSRFNPEKNIFRNYDSYDGLPRTSFSEAAACRELANGNLVFGTSDGYISFDPEHVSMKPVAANIVFTNLQINKEDARFTNNSHTATDINYTSKLTLKYNENIISIDYAILDARAGNRQTFQYRLIGFDTTWLIDREIKGVSYTNLPPGDYVLEVQSLYTDLYSNRPYKKLEITILPPPWKTWWAYTLYAIALLAALVVIRHYALKMVHLKHEIIVEKKIADLKLNFFTGVSHELRTPLTLIVNPLEAVAKKENLSAEGAAYIDIARKNANRMIRFINQLLDLRKIQSEKATLKISRVEIVSFVHKINDHFTEAIKSKQIALEVFTEHKEIFAFADTEKLDVIIYNLLSNAIKFTPQGKTIKVLISSAPADNDFTIAVHDSGPGVKADKLNKIFELFQDGDNSTNNTMKSSGIGLALTKEFVNLHGGTINAANNEDGGLTMTVKMKLGYDHYSDFSFSFENATKIDTGTATTPVNNILNNQVLAKNNLLHTAENPLLLLVEDNSDMRLFLRKQLSEFYRVETAADGMEGWQKAQSLLPDLIVSDIMMPVMDGIQLLDKVKNDINTSHIPVILLSAKYSIESQIEGLKYGADYYISKPFNNEFLITSINNLLQQRQKLFEKFLQRKQPITISPAPVVITSKDETFIKNVILAVEDKMTDPQFGIETIADAMAMSHKTFYRKFKSLTGITPTEFVRDIRLQKAKEFLDDPANNVSDVAYMAGFTSPKYFSTCFKEKYGLSPSEYIKSKQAPSGSLT